MIDQSEQDVQTLMKKSRHRALFTMRNAIIIGRWFDVGYPTNGMRQILEQQYGKQAYATDTDLEVDYLPFHPNSFDTITDFEVLEHLLNPLFHLRDVARVLKPGGTLYLSTPNGNSWKGKFAHFVIGWIDIHITEYSERWIRIMFEKAGLKITKLQRYRMTDTGTITRFSRDGFWIEATKPE